MDEILYVEGYPGYQHLLSMAQDTMKIVCEVKGSIYTFLLIVCTMKGFVLDVNN